MLPIYSIQEIEDHLAGERFPFSGLTELGSAEFHFHKPAGVIGIALHSGSRVREELIDIISVNPEDRFREEDPFVDRFIRDFPVQIIARDSRFEYDLNWEIEKSVYEFDKPKWGLNVWKRELSDSEIEISYKKFREFYILLDMIVEYLLKRRSQLFLFDMHAFCYQREERELWWVDSKPEINLGTIAVNRQLFSPLIDFLFDSLSKETVDGHQLRVVENQLFPGGYLTRKYSKLYFDRVLVLAIEYKKIFMDEWTGELFENNLEALVKSFSRTVDNIVSLYQ